MEQHFLQTEAWEKFQHALGHETIRRSGRDWSYLAIVERSAGTTRLYCPYGPTVPSLEALDRAIESLKVEAKRIGASFVRVQPFGFLLSESDYEKRDLRKIVYSQPEATRRIELSPSLDDLIANMSQSKRSICRNYQKKDLRYWSSHDPKDVDKLLPLLHDVASRNRIALHDDDYVKRQAESLMPEQASLHFISLGDDVVTGALVLEGETTNYYAHAGTASQHYKFQANTALVGEMLGYSKEQGKQWFDLYGVAPNDDPDHPWAGVSDFKAGFGGERVIYNPTFDLPTSKGRYVFYQTMRTIKQGLSKIFTH